MRTYTENANNYIHFLTQSLLKDPASLETWRCMHCYVIADDPSRAEKFHDIQKIVRQLSYEYSKIDCDVVAYDTSLFVISKSLDRITLQEIAETISKVESQHIAADIYDMFYEWRRVWELLRIPSEEIIVLPEKIDLSHIATDAFKDIDALAEVFQASQKLRPSRQPMHILLVEDDAFTRKAVSMLFKDQYALITAKDALEAITNYLLHAPDIVFLDINLPDKDGFSVLKEIVHLDKEAYVVMFSSHSYMDNITHALAEGATGFISKPFKKEKMIHYLEDCAMQRRREA